MSSRICCKIGTYVPIFTQCSGRMYATGLMQTPHVLGADYAEGTKAVCTRISSRDHSHEQPRRHTRFWTSRAVQCVQSVQYVQSAKGGLVDSDNDDTIIRLCSEIPAAAVAAAKAERAALSPCVGILVDDLSGFFDRQHPLEHIQHRRVDNVVVQQVTVREAAQEAPIFQIR